MAGQDPASLSAGDLRSRSARAAPPAHRTRRLNEDAARSLAEGLEETLTPHRLGLAERLGLSLLTTNGLESILALVEQRTGKVHRWTTSDQKQRWLATALLDIEPLAPDPRISLQKEFDPSISVSGVLLGTLMSCP